MKYKSIAILIFCTSVTPTAFAQSGNEEIAGAGTPNFIAKFLSTHKIGNSNIRQIDDNIGINTDYIVGRLSVFESRETGVNFPEPYALYGNISSGVNFAAGVRGDASS